MKNRFCAMLDMSRNGVMKPASVKKYIDYLAKMGYNSLMLYTEDTYEVQNEPLFGYLRGAYTAEEIKDVDLYAKNHGVELIPCIQTLAHLNTIFRWADYSKINDTDDILLIGEERTYTLIENIFLTLKTNFSSKTVLIGMDEAHMVGRGAYQDINGNKDSFEVMSTHLKRVASIAEKYGFDLLMWSDMFVRFFNNGEYYADNPVPLNATLDIPKNVTPIYWDYYHTEESEYRKFLSLHDNFKNVWFAGGTWCWCGFTPALQFALQTTKSSMKVCREKRIDNVIMTLWGDNGRECSCFTSLPILYFAIETFKGNDDLDLIKRNFYKLTGEDFDNFLALEYPNLCNRTDNLRDNPSKYMLYNDPFFGQFDSNVKGGEKDFYEKAKKVLANVEKKSKSFKYIFNFEKRLVDVLSVKYELGVKTRRYYKEKNLSALSEIIADYNSAIVKLKSFLNSFETLWETENKPNGFDVQQIRIGGLIQRLIFCKNKLSKYVNGKISSIPELENELLDCYGLKDKEKSGFILFNLWELNASVNNF